MPSPYRPQFEAALRLFARVSESMAARNLPRPILVGGAAVEFYTASAITTGDFDIVTPRQDEFEEELRRHGFIKPEGIGHTPLGWMHPALRLGFEVVSSTLLDGYADRSRVRMIDTGADGVASFISLEDMIADRMGQYASGTAPDMLAQARALYAVYPDADRVYLDARIRHETAGDHGIDTLER